MWLFLVFDICGDTELFSGVIEEKYSFKLVGIIYYYLIPNRKYISHVNLIYNDLFKIQRT
jgi:hypothetical protein